MPNISNNYTEKDNLYTNIKDGYTQYIGGFKTKGSFFPELRIEEHSNEFNLDLSFFKNEQIISEAAVSKDLSNKFTFDNGKTKAHIYPIDNNFGEGARTEFEIEFEDKNEFLKYAKLDKSDYVIEFGIKTKGLIFYFQPGLTKKDIENEDERPDDTVGSYAIYYDGKANNQYKCGKFGHLYAPYIFDAYKNKYKCAFRESSYSAITQTLKIYINPEIINTCQFPIKIDPTFGYTSVPITSGTYGNFVLGTPYALSEAGTLTELHCYIEETGSSNVCKIVIYDNSNNLVDYTDELDLPTSAGWISSTNLNVGASLSITTYKLGHWFNAAKVFYDSGVDGFHDSHTYSDTTPPDPLVPTVWASKKFGIYATYTAGGAAAAQIVMMM